MLSVPQVGVVPSTAMTVGMNITEYYLPQAQLDQCKQCLYCNTSTD
jgi:hypothetical protein